MGAQITNDFAGKEIVAVGILNGCFTFMADLVRQIELPVSCQFMGISSYGDDTKSSGVVKITHDLMTSIQNKDVLIIEDIVDTGLTLKFLLENFKSRNPASVQICTLLEKPDNINVDLNVQYAGFKIPNEFVVGYGLDFKGFYRNLPFVGVYRGPI